MSKDRYNDITDKDLLQHYLQTQNSEWLGVLLQRYTLLLFGLCMKYLKDETEARDSVQQVFLKVIQEVHKYKIDYFKSWLYIVAKNHCLTVLRDRKGKTPLEFTEANERVPEQETRVFNVQDEILENDLLRTALKELNKEQHECVTLFYLQKMSYQEVSEVTGLSLLQVKSCIQNGKRNLRIYLEKKLKEENTGNVR